MRRGVIALILLAFFAAFGGRAIMYLVAMRTPDAMTSLPPLEPGEHRVAVVFGAGLSFDGTPSQLLEDRLRAAESLLERGIVDRLLMTGDNSVDNYSEPSAMRRASLQRGAHPDAVAVDYGGRRTWDSCRRAREVFGIAKAVTVTNDFHRDRTVVTCRAAGIDVVGAVGTDTGNYDRGIRARWRARELGASWRGLWDGWVRRPEPAVSGGTIDIYDPRELRDSLSPGDRP